ncbi:nSTAND1 domain-containing NTPase [Streptomyces justiciae]|uniref:TIR domain-containing protein n=1 Tax=Streptomyces justiciae TaxID=2780140 RepID=A0ABU3LPJ0_9ACTN|nr:TIR domain-containing protein [Streptomyces justiciae]MDT7840983.1 TIR domain-containing protein [Streptomyces justiciae]
MANVFISHAGQDTNLAEELHAWLTADGHHVFLDRDVRDGIALGEEWEQRLHERLRWADATVCVITPAYLNSTWCTAEVAIARSRGNRLLPLHADGGTTHPLLPTVQYMDMIRAPEAARDSLRETLRRIDRTGGLGWADDKSPFPGLRPFDADLHRAFFGRNEDVERLASLLRSPAERANNEVLLVVGPSGCGKSSLVRAGLVPMMAEEPGWRTVPVFTPGVDPKAALGRELALLAKELGDGGPRPSDIRQRLERGEVMEVLDDVLALAATRSRPRLLIVMDQSEELFTQTPSDRRAEFATLLRTAAGGPVDVVATLRPEFLDRVLVDEHLAPLPTHTHTVRPLRRDTLRIVIEGPARLAGIRVTDELVAKLVDDTDSGEALPLLAFTLAQLAEGVRRDGELSLARYGELGGVQGALTRQAEAALAEAMAASGRVREEVLAGLLRLVTVDENKNPTRRHVRRDDLPEPVPTELDAFVARRLLTIDVVNGAPVIAASHEKFFTAWSPLAEAISDRADALRARRAIEEAGARWHAAGRRTDDLWERGQVGAAAVATGARFRAQKVTFERVDVSAVGHDFLHASERRNRSRRRRVLTVSAVLVALALVAGVIALVQQRSAVAEHRQAREQQLVATVRQLQAKADAALDTDPKTALRLFLAAHRIHPDSETYASLQQALTTTPYAGQLTGVPSGVKSIDYSADGRYLTAGFNSGAVMLWDVSDPLRPRQVGKPFIGFDMPADVSFTPDGRRLVTTSAAGSVRIWDLADPEHPRQIGKPVDGERDQEGAAWVSPDGSVLATSSKKHPRTRLWDLRDPARIRPLGAAFGVGTENVSGLTFSADGGMIAMAEHMGKPNQVTLWDVRNGAEPRLLGRLAPQQDVLDHLSFSADGKELVVSGILHGAGLWDVSDPTAPRPAQDQLGLAMDPHVTFSPTGHTFAATTGRDTGVQLWDASDIDYPIRVDQLRAGQTDYETAFSPDGTMLATGSDTGRVTLWNLGRAGHPRAYGPPFVGHKEEGNGEIWGLAMSQDASMLATAGEDTTVVLWNITDPARPRRLARLTGHPGKGVDAVAFSPDGRTLATGDGEQNVILWDLTDRDHPRLLAPMLTAPTNIVRTLVFSADGETLVVGGDQGTVFWDIRDHSRPRRLARVLNEMGVLGVWRVRDGRLLAVVRGTGKPAPTAPVAQPTVSPTESDGMSGSASGSGGSDTAPSDPDGARLWDLTDMKHPRQVGSALEGHEAEVRTAALSPDGDLLVTGDQEGKAIFWDLSDPDRARRLGDSLTPHGTDLALNMVFAPTTDIVVTAGIHGNAFLWDLGNRILPRQVGTALAANLDAIGHMVFSSDGSTLATSGTRGDAVLWDLTPTYDLRRHLDTTTCLVTNGGLTSDQWPRYLPALDYRDTCPG